MSKNKTLQAVEVYLKKRKTRVFVGKLYRGKGDFIFEYDQKYLYAKRVIPVGEELPLTSKIHHSKKLFPSFQDRIPSSQNPAYEEYCKSSGISKEEKDPLVLLVSIGKRGPSSFIFEPFFYQKFDGKDVCEFRKWLNLTQREFASCFDLPRSSLNKIEQMEESGKEIMKRLEIFVRFPKVALEQVQKRGGALSSKKRVIVENKLKKDKFLNKDQN